MFGTPGVQGGYLGNAGGLVAGLDLPFGGGNRYRELQKENQPGAPRPAGTSPTRVLPPNAPGREGAIDVQFRQALGGFSPMGNMGGLLAQVNPTYPTGDPRYGQPMSVDGIPVSTSTSEYGIIQGINRLRNENPQAYKNLQNMMGPYGWQNPNQKF
jgi:hypothetical protein